MKPILCLGALLFCAALARADIVVEEKTESPFGSGTLTYKIKGDLARMDSPTPTGGTITTLLDMRRGTLTYLMHSQKMVMVMDMATQREKAQNSLRMMGIDMAKAKPVATGKKQKVGEWDAEEYDLSAGGGWIMHMWVAPNYPHGELIRGELAKISKAASGGALDPNSFELPGLLVLLEAETPAGRVVTKLESAREEAVPASEFVVPEGYHATPHPNGQQMLR